MKRFLIFLLFPLLAFTGPTEEIVKWCDTNVRQERVQSDRADQLTQKLQRAYRFEGENGVDAILDKSDSSWYSGLDLYMAGSSYAVIRAMNNDLDATWRDTSIKRATVEVVYDGRTYMVLIISYR